MISVENLKLPACVPFLAIKSLFCSLFSILPPPLSSPQFVYMNFAKISLNTTTENENGKKLKLFPLKKRRKKGFNVCINIQQHHRECSREI